MSSRTILPILWSSSFLLLAACGNTGGALLANGPSASQPRYAAWIAARAKRCGFARDPETSKAAYLAFESKRGATGAQLAGLDKEYSAALRDAQAQIASDPDACTERKVAEIKAALQRQDAGDYTATFTKGPDNACGFLGCPIKSVEEPFDSKKFWAERQKDPTLR